MSDSEGSIDLPDDAGDDLFGDGDHGDLQSLPSDDAQVLSDKDLASDQDGGERDGLDDMEVDQQPETEDIRIQDIQMYRHPIPKTHNGQLKSLKPPSFVRWAAEMYKPNEFEETQWDRENLESDNPKSVIRWQRDPITGKLKSNTAVYRWSDGSITIAVGGEHYEVQKKQMAPPPDKPYHESQDSHYYAAAAHMESDLLYVVGHISEQYTMIPNKNMKDDALALFANRMQEAARGKARADDNIFTATKDPEAQRREAEAAEKERIRIQRKRESAVAREITRPGGFRDKGEGEGGRKAGGSRKRGQPGASKAKKRRPEYDSDDDLPAGRGRNEEYDREDDFIAPSDDEGSLVDDDEDEEEILDDDDDDDEAPRSKRRKTAESEDEDADADADLDDVDAPAPAAESSRNRRRHIVDDDDDE